MSLTLNISPSHPSAFLKQWIFPDDMTFTEIAKNRVSEFVKEIESYDANYAPRHDGP